MCSKRCHQCLFDWLFALGIDSFIVSSVQGGASPLQKFRCRRADVLPVTQPTARPAASTVHEYKQLCRLTHGRLQVPCTSTNIIAFL